MSLLCIMGLHKWGKIVRKRVEEFRVCLRGCGMGQFKGESFSGWVTTTLRVIESLCEE